MDIKDKLLNFLGGLINDCFLQQFIKKRRKNKFTSSFLSLIKAEPHRALSSPALPDFVQGQENTLCVVDGSGSMTALVGNTTITALDVAKALGIYFSEVYCFFCTVIFSP